MTNLRDDACLLGSAWLSTEAVDNPV